MLELLMVVGVVSAQQASSRPLPPPSAVLVAVDEQTLRVQPGKSGAGLEPEKAITLTSVEDGVLFDLDGDGQLEQVAWTAAGGDVAFLAIDVDGDGRITSGREMFGSRTVAGVRDGFAALSDIMPQGPHPDRGSIEASDPLYEKLLLWTDGNHNGISEASELRLASELFTRIGLGYFDAKHADEHGNVFRYKGWVEVRTAPGLNAVTAARDHFDRVRRPVEVALRHARR